MSTVYYTQAPNGEVFTTGNPEHHKDCTRLSQGAGRAARREYARGELRNIISPGQTVYCTLRSVSSSGMSRRISLHIVRDGKIRTIDNLAAAATETKHSDKGGLVVGGCGMDMGFHLVYSLGCALWPNGTPEPHGMRNGVPDSAGGYALAHEWL